MKRIPVVPTLIVGLAVVAMIGLGIWQLQRAHWKESLIARYAGNPALPPTIFPRTGPTPDSAMFRKSQVNCLRVAAWRVEGGRTPSGTPGYRHIAECTTGAEGQGALIDMGVSADPKIVPKWAGGIVDGLITTEPNRTSLLASLFGKAPVLRPMLVADRPAPGLAASAPPTTQGIPNNHRGYAVQWFLFAGVALVIYALALRKRLFPSP